MLSTGHLGGGRESQQQQQQRRRPAARVSLGPDSRGAAGPILGGGDCGVVVGGGGRRSGARQPALGRAAALSALPESGGAGVWTEGWAFRVGISSL